MKAIVVERSAEAGLPPLAWRDVPDVSPAPGEVLVEVHAAALNRADLMQRAGNYPPPPGASEILGLEMAGRVRSLGQGVVGLEVGERVYALLPGGGYAELVTVPASMLMRVPERMTLVQAAAVPEVFLTAYSALFWEGRLQPGETVLVHAGASGVGTAAIQMARRSGCRVFVTCGGPEKARACEALGAELAVDYRVDDFEDRIRHHLGNDVPIAAVGPGGVGGPGGVDVIVDMVGTDYFDRNLRLLNVKGRLVFVAAQSGPQVTMNILALTSKRLELIGVTLRARHVDEKVRLKNAFLEGYGHDLGAGAIGPVIDSVYPITEAQDAHAYMAENRNVGKIVLAVREGPESDPA